MVEMKFLFLRNLINKKPLIFENVIQTTKLGFLDWKTRNSNLNGLLISVYYHRYIIKVNCSLGQFKSAKLSDKEYTINSPSVYITLQKRDWYTSVVYLDQQTMCKSLVEIIFFSIFPWFPVFFRYIWKKRRPEKGDLDQRTVCKAPVCWSNYTTTKCLTIVGRWWTVDLYCWCCISLYYISVYITLDFCQYKLSFNWQVISCRPVIKIVHRGMLSYNEGAFRKGNYIGSLSKGYSRLLLSAFIEKGCRHI